jgi:ketosteroid isomerase-like protein
MTTAEVTNMFIEKINTADVDALCELMSENHIFVDAGGYIVQGREAMRKAWQGYFAMVPDYWVESERVLGEGDVVAVFGRAGGTCTSDGELKPENRWEIPAAWQAVVRNGRVVEWRVYADNEPIRRIMTREAEKKGTASNQSKPPSPSEMSGR